LPGRAWAGRGRFALLGLIDACGSISQAAKRMGMTYKNAWDAVDAMNTPPANRWSHAAWADVVVAVRS
jgi:molybdate transport system regulatory protein